MKADTCLYQIHCGRSLRWACSKRNAALSKLRAFAVARNNAARQLRSSKRRKREAESSASAASYKLAINGLKGRPAANPSMTVYSKRKTVLLYYTLPRTHTECDCVARVGDSASQDRHILIRQAVTAGTRLAALT